MAKTLLLADDSVTIQKVVNISFASEDVTLVTVDNGDDALERAKDTRPDLILADVVMPGKNGYEVCEAIKADPDLAHIPVLLLTGTFEAFDEERASRAGAAGHVAKPFEAQTLVNQVNRLLAEAPPPATPRAAPEPAAVAPPEAVTTPATGDADDSDSFDFFDDDLGDLAAPEAVAESDSVSLEDSDSAFAFGDEDLAPASPEPVREEAERPAPQDFGAAFEERSTSDRTVAIIPEDVPPAESRPADEAPVPPTALSADIDDSEFADAAEDMFAVPEREHEIPAAADAAEDVFAVPEREHEIPVAADAAEDMFAVPEREHEIPAAAGADANAFAVPEREPEDSFGLVDASSTSDEAFDFTFDSEPVAVETAPRAAPANVEADDLAQATVLDPSGAAGYDVSSSDLGDPFADEAPGRASEPAEATRLMDFSEEMDEPVAAAELTGTADFGEDLAPAVFEPEEEFEPPVREFEPPAREFEPSAREFEPPAREFEPSAREFEPPAAAEPRLRPPADAAPAEATRRPAEESALRADSVLSQIAPTLRAEIHDTLEKVAWESFGDVTEKIVADAVDRVEKIAWEVIPQLAETLIKEEIRRIKGESDD
jgi:CheY-like chemotaxis protein